MKKPKTKLKVALNDLDACPPAIRWVNGKTPAKAWRECKHPDWLLWVIAHLAWGNSYYHRGLCAAISVCIDILHDDDRVVSDWNWLVEREDAYEYVLKLSTWLDTKGQGKKLGRSVTKASSQFLINNYRLPMQTLVSIGTDLLDNYLSFDTPDVFSDLDELPPSMRAEMCREIRRVVERPSFEEVQAAAKNWVKEM